MWQGYGAAGLSLPAEGAPCAFQAEQEHPRYCHESAEWGWSQQRGSDIKGTKPPTPAAPVCSCCSCDPQWQSVKHNIWLSYWCCLELHSAIQCYSVRFQCYITQCNAVLQCYITVLHYTVQCSVTVDTVTLHSAMQCYGDSLQCSITHFHAVLCQGHTRQTVVCHHAYVCLSWLMVICQSRPHYISENRTSACQNTM